MQTWTYFAFSAFLTAGGLGLTGCQSSDPGVGPLYGVNWGQGSTASSTLQPANPSEPPTIRQYETPTTNPSEIGRTLPPEQSIPEMDRNK